MQFEPKPSDMLITSPPPEARVEYADWEAVDTYVLAYLHFQVNAVLGQNYGDIWKYDWTYRDAPDR